MNAIYIKYRLLIILLSFVWINGIAQSPQNKYLDSNIEERVVNQEEWESIIEGINYSGDTSEDEEEEEDEDVTNTTNNNTRSYDSDRSGSSAWAGVFKFLFFVIIIAAIVLLVVHLLGGGTFIGPQNRSLIKDDANINIENIEEHIYESDLDRFIRQAVESKKYALAIRLYYLAIIKELSLKKTIRWKKDKTNKDYLSEMRKSSLFKPFREATRIFERVWYGKAELKVKEYEEIKPKFADLVAKVQTGQPESETE